MNKTHSVKDFVARRGELMAELFLQDLGLDFVARPTGDFGYDFFAGISNAKGGINNIAVEVKATDHVVGNRYSIPRQQYDRWANSNIPVLLLVVDVKENKFYYDWPSPAESALARNSQMVRVHLTEVDDQVKSALRDRLAA
jgi:hypothetical protein